MTSGRPQRFILASQSPRRRELLKRAGYTFEVIPSAVDESTFDETLDPETYVKTLALAKAEEVADRFPDRLVMGADTVVDCNGEIIGKPRNRTDAEAITRRVFAQAHRVVTGLALICRIKNLVVVEVDVTVVYPKPMTEAGIAAHLAGGSWEGKAGAYAIQETGDQFVERVDGSLSNVIGLPMELLGQLLREQVGQIPQPPL
ncbi:Maf family protein [Planctomycetota bacterium]